MTIKQYILYRKYVKRLKKLYKGSLNNTITTPKPMFRALYDLAYECEKEEQTRKTCLDREEKE